MRTYVTVTYSYGGSDATILYAGSDLDTAYDLEAFESNSDNEYVEKFVKVEIWEDGEKLGEEKIKGFY
jgi:hypothetical protein